MISQEQLEAQIVRIGTLLSDSRSGFVNASEKSTLILAHQLDALRWVAGADPVSPAERFTERPAGRKVQPQS